MAGIHWMDITWRLDHYIENTAKPIKRTKADAMRKLKHLFIVLLSLGFSSFLHGQDGGKESTVGEFMRSSQRSYVVIAVMLTILTGLILYIVRLDRKISKLEREK